MIVFNGTFTTLSPSPFQQPFSRWTWVSQYQTETERETERERQRDRETDRVECPMNAVMLCRMMEGQQLIRHQHEEQSKVLTWAGRWCDSFFCCTSTTGRWYTAQNIINTKQICQCTRKYSVQTNSLDNHLVLCTHSAASLDSRFEFKTRQNSRK